MNLLSRKKLFVRGVAIRVLNVVCSQSKESVEMEMENDLYGPISVRKIFEPLDLLSKERTNSFFSTTHEQGS